MKDPPVTAFDQLRACAGRWRGSNRFHEPDTNAPDDSLSTAKIASILDGKFIRLDYTWAFRGAPRHGSFLIGHQTKPARSRPIGSTPGTWPTK